MEESKGKAKKEESGAARRMTRIGRNYIPKNLGGMSKEVATKKAIIETGLDDLWKKLQAIKYSIVEYLNKTPA